MKSMHYVIVAAMVAALVGLPSWYAASGAGAEPVPGTGANVLRSTSGRTYVGGGPRSGK